ncbi:hypothetical protein NOK90_23560 [Vibrio parahaemolyticus]|uniref:hypothetical protein n=1 Tax=Vibrio parahaemolyticus TaxID=670 RepID=UPI00226BBD08|nr:hypothetical protein [Vibrio parahaemolyticus]MCX8793742.1 hypothetical protein [Vibrio parahaemolyticus]
MKIALNMVWAFIILLFCINKCFAIPDFTRAVGLDEPLSVTLYPDNIDKNKYWMVPATLEVVTAEDNTPNIGFQHWGIARPSIRGGAGGQLVVSLRPIVDQRELPRAWAKIKKDNPLARLSTVMPSRSYMDLIIGSTLFDKQVSSRVKTMFIYDRGLSVNTGAENSDDGNEKKNQIVIQDFEQNVILGDGDKNKEFVTIIDDPSVASTVLASGVGGVQTFAFSLPDETAAIFATNAGESSSNFGVRYRYTLTGVRSRVKAKIVVNWSRFYEHIHKESSGGWFSFKGRHAVDLQKLEESGAVKMEIQEGAFESDEDKFNSIYLKLVTAQINGELIFKPTLQSSPPPGAPKTTGSFFGWSASSAWSVQRLKEVKDFEFTIDRQIAGKRTFEIGYSFQGMCKKYPNKFVAQGVSGSGCIEDIHRAEAAKRFKKLKEECDERTRREEEDKLKIVAMLPDEDKYKFVEKLEESLYVFSKKCFNGEI